MITSPTPEHIVNKKTIATRTEVTNYCAIWLPEHFTGSQIILHQWINSHNFIKRGQRFHNVEQNKTLGQCYS